VSLRISLYAPAPAPASWTDRLASLFPWHHLTITVSCLAFLGGIGIGLWRMPHPARSSLEHRVVVGMTGDQVRRVWGIPTHLWHTPVRISHEMPLPSMQGMLEYWMYMPTTSRPATLCLLEDGVLRKVLPGHVRDVLLPF